MNNTQECNVQNAKHEKSIRTPNPIKSDEQFDQPSNKSNVKADVHRTRSEFYKRLKKSLRLAKKSKMRKYLLDQQQHLGPEKNHFKENTVIDIENFNGRYRITVPLYIEVYIDKSDWQSKSKNILKTISVLLSKLNMEKETEDWQQVEFDYESLTVRLYAWAVLEKYLHGYENSSRILCATDYTNKPIGVKVLQLKKEDKAKYLSNLKRSLNYTLLCPKYDGLEFLNESKVHVFTTGDNSSSTGDKHQTNYQETTTATTASKQLPRLLCRRSYQAKSKASDWGTTSLTKTTTNEVAIDMANAKIEQHISIKEISMKLKCLHPTTNHHYNPFQDEKLILPLYNGHGIAQVDEICETVHNMIRGICLYDDHLKAQERRKKEDNVKRLNFLNFTQNITQAAQQQQPQQTQNSKQQISTQLTPTKRITPILPKLPPCIKILPSTAKPHTTPTNTNTQHHNTYSVVKRPGQIAEQTINLNSLAINKTQMNQFIRQQKFTSQPNSKTYVKLISVSQNQADSADKSSTNIQISSKIIKSPNQMSTTFLNKNGSSWDTSSIKLSNSKIISPVTYTISTSRVAPKVSESLISTNKLQFNKASISPSSANYLDNILSPVPTVVFTSKTNNEVIANTTNGTLVKSFPVGITSSEHVKNSISSVSPKGTRLQGTGTPVVTKSLSSDAVVNLTVKSEPSYFDESNDVKTKNTCIEEAPKVSNELFAMRKRQRKQDFSNLLHKCIANTRLEQKQNST